MVFMKHTIVIAAVFISRLCAADSGNQAYNDGRYSDAEKYFTQALHTAPDDSIEMFNLAAVYRAQARYAEAEPLYVKVIAARPREAAPIDGLALTRRGEGRLAEAEELAERAMTLETTARSMNVLAFILSDGGKYARAESLARRAESIAAPDSIERAEILNTLGMVYRRRGRLEKAEPLYRESVALFERTAGPESPETAAAWNNLARVLQARGHMAEAAVLYRRAETVLERAYGAGDFRVVAVARSYASVRGALVVNVAAKSQVPHCRPEICPEE
jgi:Flp pilus assembly protein TadD